MGKVKGVLWPDSVHFLGLPEQSTANGVPKMTEIYSLAAPQASTRTSRCPEGPAPSKGWRGGSCLASSRVQGLLASLVSLAGRGPASVLTRPPSLCLSVASSVSYKDAHPGAHPDPVRTCRDPQFHWLRPSEEGRI